MKYIHLFTVLICYLCSQAFGLVAPLQGSGWLSYSVSVDQSKLPPGVSFKHFQETSEIGEVLQKVVMEADPEIKAFIRDRKGHNQSLPYTGLIQNIVTVRIHEGVRGYKPAPDPIIIPPPTGFEILLNVNGKDYSVPGMITYSKNAGFKPVKPKKWWWPF